MEIFKKKLGKKAKPETVLASAPEEDETAAEESYVEGLSNDNQQEVSPTESPNQKIEVREIPICMSQSQINSLVIDNNIMLKQIISNMDN